MTRSRNARTGAGRLAARRSALAVTLGLAALPAVALAAAPIEEIVVTAQKRSESLQSVPLAVSAFSAETLDRGLIEKSQDIQLSIPNAILVGNDRFTLRGIGNNAISSTADNGVQSFLNGAPGGVLPQDDYYDLERVEVLRGPQGTLYGRNTTGGAINVITKKPGDKLEGFISGGIGNFAGTKLQGAITLPVANAFSTRFAGYYLKRDGYTENLFTGNRIDGRNQYGLRNTSELKLGERTTATLFLQYYNEDSSRAREAKRLCKADPVLGCSPNELAFDSPASQATILQRLLSGFFTGRLIAPGALIYANAPNPTDLRQVAADTDPTYKGDGFAGNLTLEHRADAFTLTSISSYSESKVEANTDWDNAALPFRFLTPVTYFVNRNTQVTTDRLLTTDSFTSQGRTWAQELRVATDNKDNLVNFTLGGFYLNSKGRARFETWHPSVELFTKLIGLPVISQHVDSNTPVSRTEAKAVFGEAYVNLSDATKLTVGGRYTAEKKSIETRSIVLSAPPPWVIASRQWSRTTGKVALDHTVNWADGGKSLLFASVSTGYKGGGLNPGNALSPDFRPETVTAYELGAKNTLFDGTLQANLSAFYYDYTDLQLGQRIAGGVLTANSDAKIKGLEAEMLWSPTPALLFDTNLSWLDTEIGDFLTVDPANPAQSLTATTPQRPVNLKGKDLPYSPKYKVKLGAQYSFDLGLDGWNGSVRADFTHQDSYFAREFNTPNDKIKAWSVIDLQARVANRDGDLEFIAYVKNVEDKGNITNSIIEDALIGSYRNVRILDPRTFGLTVTKRF